MRSAGGIICVVAALALWTGSMMYHFRARKYLKRNPGWLWFRWDDDLYTSEGRKLNGVSFALALLGIFVGYAAWALLATEIGNVASRVILR